MNASRAPCGASPRGGRTGVLAGFRCPLHRVPDQASAGRCPRRVGRRQRVGRPVDDLLADGGRVGLVAPPQEHTNELDRQKAGENQADDGQEDANACVHEGRSLDKSGRTTRVRRTIRHLRQGSMRDQIK